MTNEQLVILNDKETKYPQEGGIKLEDEHCFVVITKGTFDNSGLIVNFSNGIDIFGRGMELIPRFPCKIKRPIGFNSFYFEIIPIQKDMNSQCEFSYDLSK